MKARAATRIRGAAAATLSLAMLTGVPASRAQAVAPPSRVALVIGEGAYRSGALPAAPDDAGLVAQVLAGAGFDVTGARDLDGDGLRRAFRDFVERAGQAGPDGIAMIYFAGRAVQVDGDDYVVPVDAGLARPSDVPIEALRLSDISHALAALPIQARVVVIDGAYAGAGVPAAGAPGLALVEAEQGELLAFNAAPGTVAPATSGPYGIYAQNLVAALKQGGVPASEVFDRVRLAVHQQTDGAVVPWDSDKLTREFAVFDRAPGAPATASAQIPFAALERRPLRDFPPDQAYDVALARDTLPAYAEFLAAYPDDALARRVRSIAAVRREVLFWRAAVGGNTPGAYWTYLARYPKGPHAGDARRRLTRLAAAALPPPRFVPLGFDVPPPGPDDLGSGGPTPFDAPDLPPPPPPPVFLLPPPVAVVLERPPPPPGPVFLPMAVPVAVPFVRAPVDPGTIAPPRGVRGGYQRPRPFARGPGGDGLVVQAAPPLRPLPTAMPPAKDRSSAVEPPPVPAADRPQPIAPGGEALPLSTPAVPMPLAPPRAGQPGTPRPRIPAAPAVPSPRPPAAPAVVAPVAPIPVPPPALRPVPLTPPRVPAAAPPRALPQAPPSPIVPRPAPSPPSIVAPPARPAPLPRPVVPPRSAPPEPRSLPPQARPPAPDRAGAEPGRREPGGRHPACGHPGEPPCR